MSLAYASNVPLTGTIDGANTVFTLPFTPAAGAYLDVKAYAPHVPLTEVGAITSDWHYTKSGLSITLAIAPQVEEERPRASYPMAAVASGTTPASGGTGGSAFYQRMRSLAARQIAQYGKTLTLTRRTADPEYDTSTGVVSIDTESVSFKGLVLDIDERNIDGTTVLQADKRVLAVLDNPPQVGNAIEGIEDFDHTVMAVRPLCPGDVTVYYEMAVRA